MTGLTYRQATVADYPRIVEIANTSMSEPLSLEEFVAREQRKPDGPEKRRIVAVNGAGDIVASGNFRRWAQLAPGMFLCGAYVEPHLQGQGIGKDFLAYIEGEAKSAGATWVVGAIREGVERDRRFAEAAGYRFLQHLFESVINMAEFDPSAYDSLFKPLEREQVQIVTMADIEDTPERRAEIHHAYTEADRDTPGYETWGVANHDDFDLEFFGGEWFRPEGVTLALVDGKIVGVSALGPTDKGGWLTDFTGVLPPYRGRGIAVALKVRALRFAKESGAATVRTNNDSNNAPMLAVNSKLGFKPEPGWIYMRKDL